MSPQKKAELIESAYLIDQFKRSFRRESAARSRDGGAVGFQWT
jgi:hypothetical protein